jgi:hypothetical protein
LINLTLDGTSNVSFTRARIKQKCLVPSEKQVKERLFIIRAARLTEDVEVFVVLVDLELRISIAPVAR